MRTVSKYDAQAELERERERGNHIDDRLLAAIRSSMGLYSFSLDDQNIFLSLIWQEKDGTRLLTPRGQSRTLADVCARLRAGYSFPALASPLGLAEDEHDPHWFQKCLEIDSAYDHARFGRIFVVHPNDNERSCTPRGTFYVYDGVHRTLVLAKRLSEGACKFRPVSAVLVAPRPS